MFSVVFVAHLWSGPLVCAEEMDLCCANERLGEALRRVDLAVVFRL